jgi:hypothetical protein
MGERRILASHKGRELRFYDSRWSDELTLERGRQLSERQKRARHGGLGGKISPHGIHADARQDLRFLRGHSLLTGIVPALQAHAVGALHRATLRASLDHDRRCDLMRVARALFAL